jgi:hypothetical protein
MFMLVCSGVSDPCEDKVCDELSTPEVVIVSSIPVTAIAIIKPNDSFLSAMMFPHVLCIV